MQIDIFKANQNDLETILQLQKGCYMTEAEIYNDYNIPPLQQDLKSLKGEFKNTTILKVVVNGEIVGSVRGFIDNETAYIGKLIVKNDFQNKGIGQLLLGSIESTFKDCNRFELFTGFKSLKNLYLYNKLGYKEFKRQTINESLIIIYLEKTK
jgi:GNAT superfamily N-acetyltransferase